jgi:very-short-patch-repair endonuclease
MERDIANSTTYLQYIGVRNRCPDGHWNDFENHKKFADFIAKKEGYHNDDDLYNITASIIKNYGGAGLLVLKYKGQTLPFLEAIFPQKTWYPWLFHTSIKGWCNEKKYVKLYLEWLKERLGWKDRRDYYKITQPIIKNNHGEGLLIYYKCSPLSLLKDGLDPPEGDEEWYPWLFTSTPNNYWDDFENHKKLAKWLFKKLGFTRMEDWYSVDQNTFRNNSCSGLILNRKHYNSSHIAFLNKVYEGEFVFHDWLFKQTRQNCWKDFENRLKWMSWFREQAGYNTIEDFYQIVRDDIKRFRGGGLMNHYYKCDYIKMIIQLNPHLEFDKSKFNVYKGMAKIENLLIKNNIRYKKEYCVIRGKKNGWFRVDFILLDLNIIIEVDGLQHFQQVRSWNLPDIQRKRDNYKSNIMEKKGYRTIRILQEEIIRMDEKMISDTILPLLVKKETTAPEYIVINSEKYGDIYSKHKEAYDDDISISELYESDEEEESEEEESE